MTLGQLVLILTILPCSQASVCCGRYTCILLEQSAEIGIIIYTDRGCDIIKRLVRKSKQLLGKLQSALPDILVYSQSLLLSEYAVEAIFGHVQLLA